MAWTTPRTFVAGELVTASMLNVHIRDQFKALGQWSPGDLKATWTTHANATTTTLTELQTGFFICNGATFVQATHPLLYAALGNSTTLPDLRGRGLWMPGTQDSHAFTRNDVGGEYDHVISEAQMPAHSHDGTLSGSTGAGGSHNHSIGGSTGGQAVTVSGGSVSISGTSGAGSAHTHGNGTLAADSGGAHTHTYNGSDGSYAGGASQPNPGTDAVDSLTTSSNGAHTHTISGVIASEAAHTHSFSGSGNLSGASGASHSHTLPSATGSESLHVHALSGSFSTVSKGSSSGWVIMPPFVVGGCWLIKHDA